MRRRLPPLNALAAFEAAARLGGFTQAAREIGVAQPAVTRHVANLEAWLGTRLFHRQGNRIALTEPGEALAQLATAVLDRVEVGVRNLPRGGRDEIVIGASFGIAHLWLMPRIGDLRRHAGVPVTFVTAEDYRSFETAAIDCSIRFGHGAFRGLESDLLFAERCQIVASPALLSRYPGFDPMDPIGSLPDGLVLDHGDPFGAGWMTWAAWYDACGRAFPGPQSLRIVRSYPTMLDMICAGEGVGIGSEGLEDAQVAAGDLVRVGPPMQRPDHGYYLVYPAHAQEIPAFQKLRAALLDQHGPRVADQTGVVA